ncbi:MAG TPA: hypothetical protein DEB56_03925 [Thiobacillus sp.]|nr:hypothetical protein [Thiobacillus sp.]
MIQCVQAGGQPVQLGGVFVALLVEEIGLMLAVEPGGVLVSLCLYEILQVIALVIKERVATLFCRPIFRCLRRRS